jgi:hypothetical protein
VVPIVLGGHPNLVISGVLAPVYDASPVPDLPPQIATVMLS